MKKLIFLLCSLSLGCSSSLKSNSKAQYRNETQVTLENGLKIYFLQDSSLPKIDLQLLIPVGVVHEEKNLEGVNSFAAELLDQGTRSQKALEISDLFSDAGSGFEAQPSYDYSIFSVSALTTEVEPVMNLFFEVMTQPTFDREEVERARQQRLLALQGRRDRAGTYADTLSVQNFYGEIPYGRDLLGTSESLKRISRDNIRDFFQKHYGPEGSVLAVSGRFDENLKSKIQNLFATWKKGSVTRSSRVPFTVSSSGGLQKIESPHKAQTEIRILQPGISRAHEDFLKLRLANEILGGSFASRLNQRVRDDLGLTYSIYSFLDAKDRAGSWNISTFAKNENADALIEETKKVIHLLLKEGVTAEELKAAKNLVRAQFPRTLETSEKLGYNLLILDFMGLGVNYLTSFDEKIESFSRDEINEALRKHLRPQEMIIYQFR